MTKFDGIKLAFEKLMNDKNANFVKRVSNNTVVSCKNGVLTVCLHNTNVFVFDVKEWIVTIKTGGYYTNTTRNTINQAFGACGLRSFVSFAKGCFNVNGYDVTESYQRGNFSFCFCAK